MFEHYSSNKSKIEIFSMSISFKTTLLSEGNIQNFKTNSQIFKNHVKSFIS